MSNANLPTDFAQKCKLAFEEQKKSNLAKAAEIKLKASETPLFKSIIAVTIQRIEHPLSFQPTKKTQVWSFLDPKKPRARYSHTTSTPKY
jgi:hypothetical protein